MEQDLAIPRDCRPCSVAIRWPGVEEALRVCRTGGAGHGDGTPNPL